MARNTDRLVRDRFHHPQFYQPLAEPIQRPTGLTRRGITAHQGDHLRFPIAVQDSRSFPTARFSVQRRFKPSLNTALAQPRYGSMIDSNALSGFFILQSRPQFPLIREQQDLRVSATVGRHFAFANQVR